MLALLYQIQIISISITVKSWAGGAVDSEGRGLVSVDHHITFPYFPISGEVK